MNVLGHDSVITGIHAYTCTVRLQIAHTFRNRNIYEHARNLISWQKPHCTITERCEWSYYNCIAFYFQNNHQKNNDSNADVLASKFQIFYALYWYSCLAFICTDLKHKTAHILSKIFGFMCATGLVWFINLSTEIKVSNSSNSCANQASFVIAFFLYSRNIQYIMACSAPLHFQ